MSTDFFLALCAAGVAGLLWAERRESESLKRIFKPLASLAFILAGLAAGALASPFGTAIFAGLVLCAIGDALLLSKAPAAFLAGMGAFAAGHAAYIAAFLAGGVGWSPVVLLAAIAGLGLSAGLLLKLWPSLGDFRAPVIGYSAIITVMLAMSAAHWTAAASPESLSLFMAAAAFAVSDISVALDRFLRPNFAYRLWGLPLYYAAQCLFAVSV